MVASVLADGQLELFLASTGARYRCGRVRAAMWLALLQRDGYCDAAADMLAELWGSDPANLRADLALWVDELCDIGLMCTLGPDPAPPEKRDDRLFGFGRDAVTD